MLPESIPRFIDLSSYLRGLSFDLAVIHHEDDPTRRWDFMDFPQKLHLFVDFFLHLLSLSSTHNHGTTQPSGPGWLPRDCGSEDQRAAFLRAKSLTGSDRCLYAVPNGSTYQQHVLVSGTLTSHPHTVWGLFFGVIKCNLKAERVAPNLSVSMEAHGF